MKNRPDDPVIDETSCLERVRSGDQAAARELVEYLTPMVTRIVKSRKPWRMADEDLMQEVYLKMFTRLHQYKGEVPFRHWVSRIAVYVCIDSLRFHRRRPEYRWADMSETEADALTESLANQQEVAPDDAVSKTDLVNNLLNKLKPEDKMILQLIDVEQKTIAEVQKITGWGESMVKVRTFRARKKLKMLFSEPNSA